MVNLATTVREGSSAFTTCVWPPALSLIIRSTSSVNTARLVKNSVAMGGGGSCAAEGSPPQVIRPAAVRTAANTATRLLLMVGLPSLSDRIVLCRLGRGNPQMRYVKGVAHAQA